MKFVQRDFSYADNYTIIPISDTHDGDKNFDRAKLVKLVKHIKETDNTYAVLIGDLINNALKNSKSDVYGDVLSPQDQKYDIVNILGDIQSKILGCTSGNHEERSVKETNQDVTRDIAEMLKIPYDPFSVLYHIRCGKIKSGMINYTMFTTHGSGGGGTKGAKANKLHSLRNIILSDLYVMGHVHDIITFQDVYYIPDTRHKTMQKMKRHYTTSGAYLNYEQSYAERMCLNPSPVGFPIIHLNGTRKEIQITQ